MIRPAQPEDCQQLVAIYNHYISNTIITFEEEVITDSVMQKRLQAVSAAGLPWLVLEEHGNITGYAYASPWKERAAYRHTVECTVYLHQACTGRGCGTQLYEALFNLLQARHIHTVIGVIALPNSASVALHEKMGMEKVAHFRETGSKFGRWIDVGCWQVVLQD